MRAARRGSLLLWRLVEGVVDTSMPGAVWLVRACALSRWRLARDDHRSSLDGAEAETVLDGERRSSRGFWSGGREEKEAALEPRHDV